MAPTSAGADDNGKVQKRLLRSTVSLVEDVIQRTQAQTNRTDFDDVICEAMRDYAIKHAAPAADPATEPGRADGCTT